MATLTAPLRWLGHGVRTLAGRPTRLVRGLTLPGSTGREIRRFRFRPPWPDQEGWGGVREPRRPRRTPPTGAMALREPTGEQRTDLTR